jgi:hypothetical protein
VEIYIALERLGADEELLSIVGSWRTLSDEQIFLLLREYNADRPARIGRNDIACPPYRLEAGAQISLQRSARLR